MRKIRFGRTNVHVPTISVGTWGQGGPNVSDGISVGWTGHDDRDAKEALVAAYRAGITHWDTADAYGDGHAEELIGQVWDQVPRDDIFIATKFGWVKGPSDHYYEPKFMREQCDRSLRNMKIDVIDLHYFHHCMFGDHDEYFDDALDTMRSLQAAGKVRFIGLSDWDSSRIMKFIERVDPDVVQPYRNILDDQYVTSGLKKYVDDHDLGVAFFSPLKHGLFLGKYTEPQAFGEGDFRSRIADFRDPDKLAHYRAAADAMRKKFATEAEPVLHALTGALLTDNPTATVLLGQRNVRQAEAAGKVGEELSREDAQWVKQMYK